MGELIVRGNVRQAPAGCTVHAFDRDLRREEPLGQVPLGTAGQYEIRYQRTQFQDAEKASADLIVRVVGPDGAVLAASPIWFNAADEATIDLVVGRRTPDDEYATLVAELRPLLGGVAIADLREDREHGDISFLSGDTERDPAQIVALVIAHRLAATTNLDPEGLYALFRRGLPLELAALVALGTSVHRTELEVAIESAIISTEFRARLEAFLRALAQQITDTGAALLEPATLYAPVSRLRGTLATRLDDKFRAEVISAIGPTSRELGIALAAAVLRLDYRTTTSVEAAIRLLLEPYATDRRFAAEVREIEARLGERPLPTIDELLQLGVPLRQHALFSDEVRRARTLHHAQVAGLDATRAQAIVERSAVLEHAPREAFDALVTDGLATATQARDLHLGFELGRLTADNTALIAALRGANVTTVARVAGWRTPDWQQFLVASGAPIPDDHTADSYAAALAYSAETSFPSPALVARAATTTGPLRPHVEAMLRDNPELDVATTDFFGGRDNLTWTGVPESQRAAVRKQLMTYQRVLAVSDGVGEAEALLAKRYDSAFAIAQQSQAEFIAKSGLPSSAAKVVYAKAKSQTTKLSHDYAAAVDVIKGQFKELPVGNVYPPLVNDLLQIDGFADLFGPQNYCACDHCRSILSPAAYFVDLMAFVERYVSKPTFVETNKTSHPLYLKTRRADLWTLELSCENTDTLLPYLTIVNEILETHLDAVVSGDIYETLADSAEKHSTRVPFTLPLEELRLYLSHFGLALHDVYDLLEQPDDKIWRARLGISIAERGVIAIPDPAGVAQRFGNPGSLAAFPVNDTKQRRGFIAYAAITRAQLDELLALRFRPDLAQITIGKQSVPDELQNFPEILEHLTAARLDFIHRFLRLWRRTGWSITDLDLVLTGLLETGAIGAELDAEAVTIVARLVDLEAQLALSVEEVCALASRLPVSRDYPAPPATAADELLYERMFGDLDLTAPYHCYHLDTANPDDHELDARTPGLLAGLSISETDLLALFQQLSSAIPFDASGNTTLDRDRISLLYRHARLARALKLTIDDFIQALRINFDAASQVVESLDQIATLVDFRQWLKASPFTASELRFILLGEESATLKYKASTATATAIVLEVQASPDPDKMAALRDSLARAYQISAAQLADTLSWVALPIDSVAVSSALAATFTDGEPDDPTVLTGIVDLARGIERALSLFTNLKLDADSIAYVTAAAPALGIANRTALVLRDVEALLAYRRFATVTEEAEPLVQEVLDAYQAAQVFGDGDRDLLADLWHQERSLIDSLIDALALPPIAIDALTRISDVLQRCVTLGIDAFSLQKLALDGTFAELAGARDLALGAFSSKYADEADRKLKLEPYEDEINTLKRDALCDYVIARQAELQFRDRSEISAYFLVDVEMCGCFRTSRVVCANGSLQLYIQRCLLDLERSDPDLNPNLPDAVVDPSKIPADEWDWRKNYRVWEANRKVFLYPENYIEPDLRDTKSPIFEELESELLAQKITADTAETAYRTYMKRLAELSRLKLGGTFRDPDTGTYHFFAHTQQDPPQYYYRSWDLTTWTPWQKIELGISAPYVSAAMHLGKLYLFWTEGRYKQKDSISGGSSQLDWYEVDVNLGYSFLDEHGKWAPAQKLEWLYPSGDETISATHRIFDEDDLGEMLASKGYQKAFPSIVGSSIGLRYYNRQLNANYYFDRKLDLFNNKLRSGGGIDNLPEEQAIVLAGVKNGKAKLGVVTKDFKTETYFDSTLEGSWSPSSFVTEPFSYKSYEVMDPTREYVMHGVHGGYPRVVFTFKNQQYLIHHPPRPEGAWFWSAGQWTMQRLSTSLVDDLGAILFEQGLEEFLSLDTQQLAEKPLGITLTSPFVLSGPSASTKHVDLDGAYGDYYRELFFHVPFRIASHLNANQMFDDAKWWYERIFDPTAAESPDDAKPSDRNWRYVGFRDVTIQTMKDILSDEAAIDAYKNDPFDPHAIARLRVSAYQKTIVMKYIDNLLDWGDSLFAQDTMESINEAAMLYSLASDILGKRPVELGDCETADDDELTYEKLGPSLGKGSEFIIALESWHYSLVAAKKLVATSNKTLELSKIGFHKQAKAKVAAKWTSQAKAPSKLSPGLGVDIIKQHNTLAFCIPPNEDLLAYWDRVEDRLFKIRNCMNISGVRRSLALFAPVIDPMALVRAVAAGLGLDEALAALAAPVPPYRFTTLVEKAKQLAQTVQGFGGALLAALEKKDVEELTLLRSVHERNILQLTKDVKKRNLQESQNSYQAAVEQQALVQSKIDHYTQLIETGLTGWETMESVARHTATTLKSTESIGHMVAGIMYLIPQLGSPFAMKFGGKELGDSVSGINAMVGALAAMSVAMAESSALEASHQRREEEWDHQLALSSQEWKQLEQQRLAAELKVQIAEKDLSIHDKTIEQAEELDEFYRNKWSQLGQYEYLSTNLSRLYRDAYNVAYELARMAERAFQFERDSTEVFIAGDNWAFDRAGLLAGERLLLQLDRLEKTYLQQNVREYEVTQSFSLSLIDPRAVLALRETGTCELSLPEVLFDLTYPGQYRRVIKAVRVSLPCVAGPYTNIGAKLTLLSSKLRRTPTIAPDALVDIPNQKLTSIAASHAQNDSGMFDFNFRDERYLPFEGAGAISSWRLELPTQARAFDYDTISDVIVNVSYTAKDDGAFKTAVENQIVDALTEAAATQGMFRLFSMRHEMANALHRLLETQTADFEITQQHFPYFLRDQDIVAAEITVFLKPRSDEPVDTAGLQLSLGGGAASGWTTLPGTLLRAAGVPPSGSPIRSWTITAGGIGLDKDAVDDVLILVKYTL